MTIRNDKEEAFLKKTEALHNLRALEEIEKNPKISQRELSTHLGVALGITNALLKVLVRKGLIKIRGENNRSLSYHLTRAGVLAKSKLAVRWTLNTIDYYRHARYAVACQLEEIADERIKTIVLYGLNELSEIAALVATESGLEVKAFIDDTGDKRETILGILVGPASLIDEVNPQAVVICMEADRLPLEVLSGLEASGIKLFSLFEAEIGE